MRKRSSSDHPESPVSPPAPHRSPGKNDAKRSGDPKFVSVVCGT